MAIPEMDAAVGHSFGLEVDGVVIRAIQEVSGLKMEQEVIQLKQNTPDGKFVQKNLLGPVKEGGEATFTRGLTGDNSFEKWVKASRFGKANEARKGGAVIIYDYEGNPVKRYKLSNVWPKSLEIGSLKSGDTSVLTEKLTVTFERMDPE